MSKNWLWWIVELIIWYLFFYVLLYSIQNPVNIGGMSLVMVLLGSFGIFASPLTRHLSIWNKILDKVIKKEEEVEKF